MHVVHALRLRIIVKRLFRLILGIVRQQVWKTLDDLQIVLLAYCIRFRQPWVNLPLRNSQKQLEAYFFSTYFTR